MNRLFKKNYSLYTIFTVSFLWVSLFFAGPVRAEADFTITAYDVHVKAGSNNILDITEKITVNFSLLRHGIYRNIPLLCTVSHTLNGVISQTTYRVYIKGVAVTDGITGETIPFENEVSNDNLVLTIGDADKTILGEKTYVIRYRYLIGEDGISQFDEFNYNLIGSKWNTLISNISFTIDMPAPFDKNKLSITSGIATSADSLFIKYAVQGNTITGKVAKTLYPGEGVTARIELPDGYFITEHTGMGWVVFYLILAGASLVLFFIFHGKIRNSYSVKTTPLEDINPAEADHIRNGYISSRGVASLIIYWADKGYLTVSGQGEDFTLIKRAEADDRMKPHEQLMFNKLFEFNSSVKVKELKNGFYHTISKVKQLIAESFAVPERILYTTNSTKAQWACFLISVFTAFVIVIRPAVEGYYNSAGTVVLMIFLALLLLVVGMIILAGMRSCAERTGVWTGLLFIMIVAYLLMLFVILKSAEVAAGPLPWGWLGVVSAIVSGLAGAFCRKRTTCGQKWINELLGLRQYIRNINKEKAEELLRKDPSLFYSLIPYAYAMNITKTWASRFSAVSLLPPAWFIDDGGSDGFNAASFLTYLNSNTGELQSSITSSPADGSSGGGDSGGGFGGGGGGSW